MNVTIKLQIALLPILLSACGTSTQADVDKASRDRAVAVAKAQQAAQPSLDAANRGVANAEQNASATITNALVDTNREVSGAVVKKLKEDAKAEYDVAIAQANGDLSVGLEKCRMQQGELRNTCEHDVRSAYDQSIANSKAKLEAVNQQG